MICDSFCGGGSHICWYMAESVVSRPQSKGVVDNGKTDLKWSGCPGNQERDVSGSKPLFKEGKGEKKAEKQESGPQVLGRWKDMRKQESKAEELLMTLTSPCLFMSIDIYPRSRPTRPCVQLYLYFGEKENEPLCPSDCVLYWAWDSAEMQC